METVAIFGVSALGLLFVGAISTAIATIINRIAGLVTAAGWLVLGISVALVLGKVLL